MTSHSSASRWECFDSVARSCSGWSVSYSEVGGATCLGHLMENRLLVSGEMAIPCENPPFRRYEMSARGIPTCSQGRPAERVPSVDSVRSARLTTGEIAKSSRPAAYCQNLSRLSNSSIHLVARGSRAQPRHAPQTALG